MDNEDMIERHMREVYDTIWEHFDRTRYRPWSTVTDFISECSGRALDLACGNGRHVQFLEESCDSVVGVDSCTPLLASAMNRSSESSEFIQADAMALPFTDGAFDSIIFIAALHHLPSRGRRKKALEEVLRVLGSDGRGLISVWSIDQERHPPEALKKVHRTRWGEVALEHEHDFFIPWKMDSTYYRFYHLFDRKEFLDEVSTVFPKAEVSTEGENHYALFGV